MAFYYVLTYQGQVFAGIIEGLALFVPKGNPTSFVPFKSHQDAWKMRTQLWEEQAVLTEVEFSDTDEGGQRFVESLDAL